MATAKRPVHQVPVLLKTKKHIKAYLLNNYGDKPFFDCNDKHHNTLLALLSKSIFPNMQHIPLYEEDVKIYISKSDYLNHGAWMGPKQMLWFNQFVNALMIEALISRVDSYMELVPNARMNKGIDWALEKLRMNDEDWNPEAIIKSYYRWRKKHNRQLFYNKN